MPIDVNLFRSLVESGVALYKIQKEHHLGQNTVRKMMLKLGISTPRQIKRRTRRFCPNCNIEIVGRMRRNNIYCTQECRAVYQKNKRIQDWISGEISGTRDETVASFVRNWLIKQSDNKCSRPNCRWGEKNPRTGIVPLTIHHIDGDSQNNRPNNLEVLCPNCHSITYNYGYSGKKSGRTMRKVISRKDLQAAVIAGP